MYTQYFMVYIPYMDKCIILPSIVSGSIQHTVIPGLPEQTHTNIHLVFMCIQGRYPPMIILLAGVLRVCVCVCTDLHLPESLFPLGFSFSMNEIG